MHGQCGVYFKRRCGFFLGTPTDALMVWGLGGLGEVVRGEGGVLGRGVGGRSELMAYELLPGW